MIGKNSVSSRAFFVGCYRLDVCVALKLICWNLNPQKCDIFSIFSQFTHLHNENNLYFTRKWTYMTICIPQELAKIASIKLMIENRLWSCRSAGWANISVKVEMLLKKNKVSSLKNYSEINCHLSCKDNFRVGSDSEATNLGTGLYQLSNFFSTL